MITMADLRISVIIPHLNQPQELAICLAALQSGTRTPDEIIVVDNGSQVLPDVPDDVTLLQENTPGPGPARNLGVAGSHGDLLAFLDADCVPQHDWLAQAAQAMTGHDILGGDVRIAYANPDKLTLLEAYESIYAYRIAEYIRRDHFAGTGNLMVKRAVFAAVGPFAGRHIAEDREWGQRATALGIVITYAPQMRVYHAARGTFAEIFQKWDRQLAHDYADLKGGRLRWLIKACAIGLSPVVELGRIALSDRVSGWGCKMKACAAMCCIRVYRMARMLDLLLRVRPERLAARWNR